MHPPVVRAVALNIAVAAMCAGFAAGTARAQPPDATAIVALANGRPVTFLQVKRALNALAHGKAVPPEIVPMLQAQALEQAILRRLMVDRLKELGCQPTAAELQQAQENFESNLTLAGLTRQQYLTQNYLNDQDLDELRYWEICWNRYAGERLTEEELKRYFAEQRRDFDGTQLRVSHILLRIEGRREQADVNAALAEAARIREEITAGKLTFADAARKYSSGPSRDSGGDLGLISRREPMVEEFSSSAFKLQKGEISPPTVTPFGVHLITVTEEQPGSAGWADVLNPLTAAARNDLFRRTAAELRKSATVEYTGLVPHFDAATGRVVMPAK